MERLSRSRAAVVGLLMEDDDGSQVLVWLRGQIPPCSNGPPMTEPSDRDLMGRLSAGDREALDPLMDRHRGRLYRIALAYLRQPDDALDVVQETFVKAYIHAARWDGGSEVGPWLT